MNKKWIATLLVGVFLFQTLSLESLNAITAEERLEEVEKQLQAIANQINQYEGEKTDLEKSDTDSEPELTENEVAKAIEEDKKKKTKKIVGKYERLADLPENQIEYIGPYGAVFDEQALKFADTKLKKEITIQKEIEKKESMKRLQNINAIDNSDNSVKSFSKTEVHEAPVAVDNPASANAMHDYLMKRGLAY